MVGLDPIHPRGATSDANRHEIPTAQECNDDRGGIPHGGGRGRRVHPRRGPQRRHPGRHPRHPRRGPGASGAHPRAHASAHVVRPRLPHQVLFTTPAVLDLGCPTPHRARRPAHRRHPGSAAIRRGRPRAPPHVRQCLAHQTHLPAVEPLYTYGQDPATLRAFVLQRHRGGPGAAGVFGHQLHPARHRHRAADGAHPLARSSLSPPGLSFRPDPHEHSAATERCTWRGRVLQRRGA